MKRLFLLFMLLILGGYRLPMQAQESAAIPGLGIGPCGNLTVENSRSAECDAEIAAVQLPTLVQPVDYVEERDGEARSRAVLLPTSATPYPIAWQIRAWYFSDVPGVLPENDYTEARRISKYTLYYVYQYVEVDGQLWFLIGPGQWMPDEFVAVLQIPPRPEGVSGPWVIVDITQQVLIALNDDQPVFATLISSGYWRITRLGLFQVYARTLSMTMSGPPGANPPDYVLPNTPWVMFFDQDDALHGARYHNHFGQKRSHGCVNLAPGDAEWVWNFFDQTAEQWHPSYPSFRVDDPSQAPWVYVYESDPNITLPMWGQ